MSMNDNRYTMPPHQLESAKAKEIENARVRLIQRGEELSKIINRKGKEKYYNWNHFGINGFEQMIEETLDAIRNWNGGKYKKPVETEKDCFIKTRNYWCHEKVKPIANSMIYPVLSQLCHHINRPKDISPADKVLLYIGIMKSMLNAKIQFVRTSAKPLILNAMFFKPNKFKKHCIFFIKYFNLNGLNTEYVEWGSVKTTRSVKKSNETKATSKYIPDSNRAQSLHDSFVNHLRNIEEQISNCKNMDLLQTQLSCFMFDMGVKIENVNNNRYQCMMDTINNTLSTYNHDNFGYNNHEYNNMLMSSQINDNIHHRSKQQQIDRNHYNQIEYGHNMYTNHPMDDIKYNADNNGYNNGPNVNNNNLNSNYMQNTEMNSVNTLNNSNCDGSFHGMNQRHTQITSNQIRLNQNELICDCSYSYPQHFSVNNQQQTIPTMPSFTVSMDCNLLPQQIEEESVHTNNNGIIFLDDFDNIDSQFEDGSENFVILNHPNSGN